MHADEGCRSAQPPRYRLGWLRHLGECFQPRNEPENGWLLFVLRLVHSALALSEVVSEKWVGRRSAEAWGQASLPCGGCEGKFCLQV